MTALDLQKILKLHKHVVPTKTQMHILKNVLVLPDTIISTDLVWRLETPCKIPGAPEKGCLIEFAELQRTTNFLEGEVRFGPPKEPNNSDHLGFYGDGAIANVYQQDAEEIDFPNAPKSTPEVLSAEGLLEAFLAVANFTSQEMITESYCSQRPQYLNYIQIKDGTAVGLDGYIFKTVKATAPDALIPADKAQLLKAFAPTHLGENYLGSPLGKLYFKPLDGEFPKWRVNAEKGEYLGKLTLDKKLLGRIKKLRLLLNDRAARVKLTANGGFKLETDSTSFDLGEKTSAEFSAWFMFPLLQKILDDIGAGEVRLYRSTKEHVLLFETDKALYGIANRNDKD